MNFRNFIPQGEKFRLKNFSKETKILFSGFCHDVNYNQKVDRISMRCFRPDSYGLPCLSYDSSFDVSSPKPYKPTPIASLPKNWFLLGSTMLNCWNSEIKWPHVGFQRVDMSEKVYSERQCNYIAESELPMEDQQEPKQYKKLFNRERAHLNTFSMRPNEYDAKCSNSQLNIIPLTTKHNKIDGIWERTVIDYMIREKCIGHITTIMVPKGTFHDPLFNYSFTEYKVVFYERGDEPLQLKCYLIYDEENDRNIRSFRDIQEVKLGEVESKTELKFLNANTLERLDKFTEF